MTERRHILSMLSVAEGATMALVGTPVAKVGIKADVRPWEQAEEIEHTFGVQRVFHRGPTNELSALEVGSLRLKLGTEPRPPHQHPDEEILLVTE